MDQRQIANALDKHMTAVRAVAFAFAGSVAVYALVAWLLLFPLGFDPAIELPFVVAPAIAAACLGLLAVSHVVRRSMLSSAGRGDDDAAARVQQYVKASTVALAMREVPAVVGLVLSLLSGHIAWVLGLGAAALVTMAIDWPRRDAVEDWLQQQRMSR